MESDSDESVRTGSTTRADQKSKEKVSRSQTSSASPAQLANAEKKPSKEEAARRQAIDQFFGQRLPHDATPPDYARLAEHPLSAAFSETATLHFLKIVFVPSGAHDICFVCGPGEKPLAPHDYDRLIDDPFFSVVRCLAECRYDLLAFSALAVACELLMASPDSEADKRHAFGRIMQSAEAVLEPFKDVLPVEISSRFLETKNSIHYFDDAVFIDYLKFYQGKGARFVNLFLAAGLQSAQCKQIYDSAGYKETIYWVKLLDAADINMAKLSWDAKAGLARSPAGVAYLSENHPVLRDVWREAPSVGLFIACVLGQLHAVTCHRTATSLGKTVEALIGEKPPLEISSDTKKNLKCLGLPPEVVKKLGKLPTWTLSAQTTPSKAKALPPTPKRSATTTSSTTSTTSTTTASHSKNKDEPTTITSSPEKPRKDKS